MYRAEKIKKSWNQDKSWQITPLQIAFEEKDLIGCGHNWYTVARENRPVVMIIMSEASGDDAYTQAAYYLHNWMQIAECLFLIYTLN